MIILSYGAFCCLPPHNPVARTREQALLAGGCDGPSDPTPKIPRRKPALHRRRVNACVCREINTRRCPIHGADIEQEVACT